MSQADANRVQLSFIEESVWGTTPGTVFQELRITGESLAHTINSITSAELRDDRQVTDLIQVDENPAGAINFELSYGTFDSFLEGALWSSWSTNLTKSDVSIAANPTGLLSTKASQFHDIVVGQWIEVGGFTTTGNNTYYLVTAKNAASSELTTTPTPATEAEGDTITIGGSYIRNGVTKKSYVLERKHSDITQYFLFSGMVVDQLQISVAASSIITGSFSFIGKNTTLAQTPAVGTAPTVATTTPSMNAATNVGTILEGSTLAALASGLFIQSLDLTIANNVRALKAIANAGTADIGVGQVDITGTMNTYLKDNTLADKFFAATATGLSFKCQDSSGNAYIFTVPKIKFESDGINASGANQDVMENLGWRAVRHSTAQDYTCQICKFSA
jgi:hypothetical protein